jgi:hypothetical protein
VRLLLVPLLTCLLALSAAPAFAQRYPTPDDAQTTTTPDPDEAADPYGDARPTPTAPPPSSGADASYYDSRVRASADAAEGLQGPLDGGWTVRSDDGADLYGLQIVDPGTGVLEGAWRDMRSSGSGAHGLVASLQRYGDELDARFTRDDGRTVALKLQTFGDYVWGGALWDGSRQTAVSLIRNKAKANSDYTGAHPAPFNPYGSAPRRAARPRAVVEERHRSRGRHATSRRASAHSGKAHGTSKKKRRR